MIATGNIVVTLVLGAIVAFFFKIYAKLVSYKFILKEEKGNRNRNMSIKYLFFYLSFIYFFSFLSDTN